MNWKDKGVRWLLLPSLVKLFLAATIDLSVDEAHYVLYGRWVDWSYFDHPPMVGWIQAVLGLLPFSELLVRLPAIGVGAFLAIEVFQFLKRQGVAEKNAFWASMAIQVSPAIFGMTFFCLPETPFLFFAWLFFKYFSNLKTLNFQSAVRIGFLVAMMGLSKYTAGLLLPGIFIEAYQRGWLKVKKDWKAVGVAVLTALIFITPVLIWNFKNDFISFRYQTDHVVKTGFHLQQAFTSLLGLWAACGFFLFPIVVGAFSELKVFFRDSQWRFAILFVSFPCCFFLYTALTNEVLPHWATIIFFYGIMIGIARAGLRYLYWIKWAVVVTALIDLVIVLQLFLPMFPGAELISRDVRGWKDAQEMISVSKLDKKYLDVSGLITTHWTYGSRAVVYISKQMPVHVVDERVDMYDRWLKTPEVGKNFFVLNFSFETKDLKSRLDCGELALISEKTIRVAGQKIYDLELWHCRKYLPLQTH